MSPLRAATSGATPAWGLFSSPIGIPRLAIRVGAAASTIIRCNGAGGKTKKEGEMSEAEFRSFLADTLGAAARFSRDGAVYGERLNLCISHSACSAADNGGSRS